MTNTTVVNKFDLVGASHVAISHTLLERAYAGTSFNPERRAARLAQEIVTYFEAINDKFNEWATGENVDDIRADLAWYKDGYLRRYREYLYSHSRVMSPMITGPARFPTASNNKKFNAADNKYRALVEFERKWLARFESKWNPNSIYNRAIRTGEDGAVERMEEKIDRLEARQEMMKSVNKIVRSKAKKATDAWKRQALTEAGFTDKQVADLMIPNRWSREIGYAGWELSNNNATIRNSKKRLVELKAAQARIDTADEDGIAGSDTYGDIDVIQNAEANRVQIIFPGKPDSETRRLMKRAGFRWSPRFSAWQRQLTDNGIATAKQLAKSISESDAEYA